MTEEEISSERCPYCEWADKTHGRTAESKLAALPAYILEAQMLVTAGYGSTSSSCGTSLNRALQDLEEDFNELSKIAALRAENTQDQSQDPEAATATIG